MLPGISSVLRRERRPTSDSSSHSPQLTAVPSAPLPALPNSAGATQLSSSSSARRAAALVASAREAQAASAAARQGNGYGDEGPMLPEEMRARERERERAVRQQIQGGAGQSAAGSSRGDRAGRESQGSDGASGPRYSSSHMESSVTRLLVATKMLLEALTKWSTGQRTETQVSDIYVRLGNDFNTANHAFGSYGIDMSDLASVPDDLRACLERCLSEDASPQVLEVHLPPIREIIINLLQGLKLKQAEYKQYLLAQRTASSGGSGHRSRGSRSERSNTGDEVSGHRRSTTGSISRRPIAPPPVHDRPLSRPGSMVASPTIAAGLSEHDEPRRRGTGGSSSIREAGMTPQASTDGSTVYESLREEEEDTPPAPAEKRAPNDIVRHSLVDGPVPGPATEQTITPTNSLAQLASTSAVETPVNATSPPLSSTSRTPSSARGRRAIAAANAAAEAESDPSLRALKSRDALERRASKRFSAYTFNKMGVGTPQGFGLGMGLSSLGGAAMSLHSPSSSPLAERRPTGEAQRAGKRLMRGISGGPPSDAASSGDEARRTKGGEGTDAEGLPRSESEELTPGPLNGKARLSPHPSPRVQGSASLAPPPAGASNANASSTESLPYVDAADPSPPISYEQMNEVPPVPPLPTTAERRKLDAAQARAAAPTSNTLSLFLQLGRQTRRAQLELLPGVAGRGLSVGKLRMLFMDRFGYSPGKEDFPTIYVKDVPSGVSYELEDLNELQDGAVLTLNIEPLDQVKQHLDLVLGTITRELRDLKTAVHDRERDREANRRASINYASDALAVVNAAAEAGPSSRITDSQFTSAGARVAQQLKRAGTLREEAAEGVDSPTMSTASHSSGATSGARIAGELKHQYDEVQALRRELAVLRQIQSEFGADVGGLLAKLREQSARVRAIASAEVPAERNFIIAGKARLDGNSQEVLTLVEDLQDTVDDLKLDVINRGVKPKPALMRKVGDDIARATRGLEELEKYVETVKPSWKKTWEAELQNIVDEQEFLNHQEGLIADLRDDHGALQDVYENIQQVVKLRGVGRPSGAGGKGFLPPPPEEGHEGLTTVMLEVRGQSVDHEKRLKALHAAERLRAKEIASRTDEFTDELSGFVEGKALRKTGGHLEAERVRSRRDQQTMRAMFSGGADAIGGAPGAGSASRPPPKLLLGGKPASREGPVSPQEDPSSPISEGDA